MPPSATSSTFQIGTWNALTDAFTQTLDLNDGTTWFITNGGLKLPQPDKNIIMSGNVRTAGVVVPRWQYKERHIQVEVSLRGASTTAILSSVRSLIAAIEQPPYCIRLALPGSSQYSYADVQAVKHDIPNDPQILLAKAITKIHMDFTCAVGLRGDRVVLQNLVVNPGFEQPSGPSVLVFNDSFANTNFYATQAGSAPTAGSVNNNYPDVVMADAPLRYYRMSEVSGVTAYDVSGSGQHATYVGSPTLGTTSGISGDAADKAVTFNGTSQYATVPLGAGSAALPTGAASATSVECWFKIAANPATSTRFLVQYGDSGVTRGAPGIAMNTSGGVFAATNGGDTAATAAVSLNVWHHAVATWDGTTLRIYLDGVAGPTATPGALAIGAHGATIGSGEAHAAGVDFPGVLDEVAIYNTTLSAARVTAHFNAGNAGTGMGTMTNALTVAASARVSFGSPAWSSINYWQTRFRFTSGGTYNFYLHYTDANNYLQCQITGTAMTLNHRIAGVTTQLGTTAFSLGSNVWYWLRVTQFPAMPGEVVDVQASLYNDNAGFNSLAPVGSTVGPVPTQDAVTALSGRPQIEASGASLILGGPYNNVHLLTLFGPGGWTVTPSSGSAFSAGAWEGQGLSSSNTYSGGPVSSYGALRFDAPPAGTWDDYWSLYSGGSPTGTWAIAATATQVVAASVWAKTSGLSATSTVYLQIKEYDASGSLLRTDTVASAAGNTLSSWTQLSGTVPLGASCAYIDVECRAADTTANSANGIVWFDNAQLYNQTTTGATSMSWCDLREPRGPAQLVVSGLVGDMVAPAFMAIGTFCSSWPTSGTMQLFAGRKLTTSPTAQLVGPSYGAFSASYSPQATAGLDTTAYGGFNNSASVGTGGWNPRFASPTANDAAGIYHLLARVKTAQIAGNLPNMSLRVVTAQQTDAWLNQVGGADIVGQWFGPYVYPFTASNTWLVVDAGQCILPPFPQGGMTDPSKLYLTPRAQWQDTTGGSATGNTDWQALVPIDGCLLMATLNNPSNSSGAVTNSWLWTYVDGLLVNRGGSSDVASWALSTETGPTPNPSYAASGPGTSGSGSVNVNTAGDPFLTLDPTQKGANSSVGVNQLVALVADQAGSVYPLFGEVRYSPLYLYPR